MYSLSIVVESHTWDTVKELLEELRADERTIPCGVIHEGNRPIEFNNTFELLKAVQERIEIKQKMIRFSLFNIEFETYKVILNTRDYVLSYKG